MLIVQLRKSVRALLTGAVRERRRSEQVVPGKLGNGAETAAALADLAERGADLAPARDCADLRTDSRLPTSTAVLDYAAALEAFQKQEFARALFILERLPVEEVRTRLLLNICRCQTGRKAEAQLDLYQWSREADFPVDGGTLLVLLLEAEGDQRAVQHLLENANGIAFDSGSGRLFRILKLQGSGQIAAARQLARAADSHRAVLQRLGLLEQTAADFDPVARLSDELVENEDIIKSLCIGLRCQAERGEQVFLARGIERALPRLEERGVAVECIAELYLNVRRFREARLWILRGMRDFPRSTGLPLLLLRLPEEFATGFSPTEASVTTTNQVRSGLSPSNVEVPNAVVQEVPSAAGGRKSAQISARRVG